MRERQRQRKRETEKKRDRERVFEIIKDNEKAQATKRKRYER